MNIELFATHDIEQWPPKNLENFSYLELGLIPALARAELKDWPTSFTPALWLAPCGCKIVFFLFHCQMIVSIPVLCMSPRTQKVPLFQVCQAPPEEYCWTWWQTISNFGICLKHAFWAFSDTAVHRFPLFLIYETLKVFESLNSLLEKSIQNKGVATFLIGGR